MIVPLNRPALSLGAGPRSVQQARRWVVDTIRDIDRPELVETAELAVSELVTNAVLHAEPPIEVRVRGTRRHPRVEVRDGSTEQPVVPTRARTEIDPADLDEDLLLVTFGRGLDIVSRCADAWGAEIEDTGKVVWFSPAAETRENGVVGMVTGQVAAGQRPPRPDTHPFRLLGVPLAGLDDFRRHYQELRREVRLLALAHEHDYPLAKTLSDMFGSMQRELREGLDVHPARSTSGGTVDLTIRVSGESAKRMGRFVELLDFADQFCSRERMLSLARNPAQQAFQNWFLTEFVRQQAGHAPQPWTSATSYPAQA